MSDNLLDRMAAALRWASTLEARESLYDSILTTEVCGSCAATLRGRDGYVGQHDPKCQVGVILAEFERDKERLVTLTLKPISELPQEMETGFCVLLGDGPGLYVAKPQGFLLENAYAFAPLPPVPGPEVFK